MSWEEIRAEAGLPIERYAEVVGSRQASSLALRYINHLRLPYPIPDVQEYVLGLWELPPDWPQTVEVESFLYRMTLADPSGVSAHVTLALANDVEDERIGIIFDIDAFRSGRFTMGDEIFWETFQELRDLKNRIFFGGITERTVEMYL